MRPARCRWLPVLLLALAPSSTPALDAATIEPRASLVLEPPVLEIGDVATLELAVVTDPGWRLLPIGPPEVPGVWVLYAGSPDVERGETHWVHRVRLRVRPRDVGTHLWPETTLVVEDPSGARRELEVPARSFEVASVWPTFPDRHEPFGLQSLRASEPMGGLWLLVGVLLAGVLLGALGVLALRGARGAIGLWRARRPARRGEVTPDSPHEWARAALAALEEDVDRDPRAVASTAAAVLRRYLDRRYGTDVRGATTGELEAGAPVWFLRSRWHDLLAVLHTLDDARFRPGAPSAPTTAATSPATSDQVRAATSDQVRAATSDRVRAALHGARVFVADVRPGDAPGSQSGRETPVAEES